MRRNGSCLSTGIDSATMKPAIFERERGPSVSTQPVVAPKPDVTVDFMPLHGIDHVELYVGNAVQSAFFYIHALGFKEVAYAGLETGVRDRTSHVLEQGRIRLVLTGALTPGHEIGAHQAAHGDGACADQADVGAIDSGGGVSEGFGDRVPSACAAGFIDVF